MGRNNPLAPNKSLQRSVNHKVLGRGREVSAPDGRRRARVLTSQPAAAELSRYTTLLHRAIACAFLLLCSLLSQTANAADSIDQVGVMLAQVSGAKVRGFSTRDFGRDQYPLARSVLVSEAKAPALLKEVRRRLPPGFIAFIGTSNILGEPPVTVAELIVAPGRDQFDILRVAASDAVNYDMLTEDLVKELQAWHREFGIDIWQADTDTISLDLKTLPTDVEAFAKRVYKFCPDIVDQSTGKLSDLVRNIRAERQVYLWWD